MAGNQFVGKAGQLAVMAELAFRGYNIAMPEVAEGDDVFVIGPSGVLWRLQVKTGSESRQQNSSRYAFNVRETQITEYIQPDLIFVFVMRKNNEWKYVILERALIYGYTQTHKLGTPYEGRRTINIVLHDDGRVICSDIDLAPFLNKWDKWPAI